MTIDDTASLELEQLRRILLGPIDEANEARDKKVLDFIKSETAATAERLNRIEARLNEVCAMVENDRRGTLTEVGKAITELGQQLKQQAADRKTGGLPDNIRDLAVGDSSR